MRHLSIMLPFVTGFAGLCAAHHSFAEGAANKSKWRVQLHAEHSVFPQGCTVPLVFDYCHDGPGGVAVEMNHLGVPYALEMKLIYPDGSETDVRKSDYFLQPDAGYDPPSLIPQSDLFMMPKGGCIRLAYDINRLFRLDRHGRYTLRLHQLETELARFSFEIVNLKVIDDQIIRGHAEASLEPAPVVTATVPIQCRMQIGTAVVDGVEHRFIVAREKRVGNLQESGHEFWVRVPRGAFPVMRLIDVRWRLWMGLRSGTRSGSKNALVIADLRNGTVRTAIGWTEEEIVFRSTSAQYPFTGWLVAAGTAGSPMLSTLSEELSRHDGSIDLTETSR